MSLTNRKYHDSRTRSRRIALCGVLCGLSLVFMYIAGLTGLGTFAGPIAASVLLIPLREEFGAKPALMAWAAAAFLSMFIMPDREMALFFLCFGWYPVCIRFLYQIKNRVLRISVKLGIYLLVTFLMYGVLCALLGIDPEIDPAAVWINRITLLLGAVCFLFVDVVCVRLIILWNKRWRNKIMK